MTDKDSPLETKEPCPLCWSRAFIMPYPPYPHRLWTVQCCNTDCGLEIVRCTPRECKTAWERRPKRKKHG